MISAAAYFLASSIRHQRDFPRQISVNAKDKRLQVNMIINKNNGLSSLSWRHCVRQEQGAARAEILIFA